MSQEKRKCTNCAFCEKIGYGIGYIPRKHWTEQLRCWHHPDVCDHPRVVSFKEGEKYVCELHMFREEREKQLLEIDRKKYVEHWEEIRKLEEKHPEFKEMKI